jgi:hypothetical protein
VRQLPGNSYVSLRPGTRRAPRVHAEGPTVARHALAGSACARGQGMRRGCTPKAPGSARRAAMSDQQRGRRPRAHSTGPLHTKEANSIARPAGPVESARAHRLGLLEDYLPWGSRRGVGRARRLQPNASRRARSADRDVGRRAPHAVSWERSNRAPGAPHPPGLRRVLPSVDT